MTDTGLQGLVHRVHRRAWRLLPWGTLKRGFVISSNAFLEEINSRNKLTGTIVFDVPKKTKPSKLLLRVRTIHSRIEVETNVDAAQT